MPRERENRDRLSNTISPEQIYIIATEGETEQLYFEAIDTQSTSNKVTIELVPKVDSKGNKITESNPRNTLKYLKLYNAENNIKNHKYKEFWLLSDVDRWGEQIDEVYIACKAENYFFALSNPCFEIWLLLHRKPITDFTAEQQELLLRNPKVNEKWEIKARAKRRYIEKHLISICEQYSKSTLNTSDYIPYINDAITNAITLHIDKAEKYPTGLGTHVYILVKKILNK